MEMSVNKCHQSGTGIQLCSVCCVRFGFGFFTPDSALVRVPPPVQKFRSGFFDGRSIEVQSPRFLVTAGKVVSQLHIDSDS